MSSSPVGSSASTSTGSVMRARAMATRCCSPPDNWVGRFFIRFSRPTRSRASTARRCRSFAGHSLVAQRQLHVLHGVEHRQQVVLLEDEADHLPPHAGELVGGEGGHVHPVEDHPPGVGGVQQAQQVEQGGLARAGGPHDGEELTLVDVQAQVVDGPDLLAADAVYPGDALGLYHGPSVLLQRVHRLEAGRPVSREQPRQGPQDHREDHRPDDHRVGDGEAR